MICVGDQVVAETNGKPLSAAAAKTILVVEDDVLIRLAVADDLMAAGFRVVQAANADEALKVLESKIALDLVVTDIRMPGSLDGLALAARIRQQWSHVRIVVVSGELLPAPPVALADAFVPKPYSFSTVLACINQLLGRPDDQL
jgi:two-component system, response regulator PdtaR